MIRFLAGLPVAALIVFAPGRVARLLVSYDGGVR